jgi:repressor of nif and glnA expression
MQTMDKKTRKRLAILDVLGTTDGPVSSRLIAEALQEEGQDISERTVRFYLRQLQDEGLTASVGRQGHMLTERGHAEHGASRLMERVGYMATQIDQMTYRMSFDLELRSGTVAVNTALVTADMLRSRLDLILKVFEKRYSMGNLVALLHPGEQLGDTVVPDGMLGLCTVCSVTLNGVLLKHGVPTRSIFSGLLDMVDDQAVRFSELINYDGTSLDPLELFIRGGMTNYVGAVTTGTGRIGAGFREVPADSYELVVNLADRADRIGLGGFLRIGRPAQTLFNIPVRQGCCGAVVIGGLNPIAILEETGERVKAWALSGLMDFHRLFPYHELTGRLKE